MWSESKSEVVRIEEVLVHNGTTGETLFQKFRTAKREDVRLAAAIRGYFFERDAHGEDYFSYLRSRIRPAAEALIECGRVRELGELEQKGLFDEKLMDDFLGTAIAMGRSEIIVWLLQVKKNRYGFPDRDFSL